MLSSILSIPDTTSTHINNLSLHDALPIWPSPLKSPTATKAEPLPALNVRADWKVPTFSAGSGSAFRSEEHTSELQSRENLVCRLLLEKKKSLISHLGTLFLLVQLSFSMLF